MYKLSHSGRSKNASILLISPLCIGTQVSFPNSVRLPVAFHLRAAASETLAYQKLSAKVRFLFLVRKKIKYILL